MFQEEDFLINVLEMKVVPAACSNFRHLIMGDPIIVMSDIAIVVLYIKKH